MAHLRDELQSHFTQSEGARQGGLRWESIAADLKYAVRALRHSPAFTAVVVIVLMLGIGANTAIFSVVRGVLLKPLPHRDGDRLVYLRQSSDRGSNMNFSVSEVRDFRTGVKSLAQVAEYSPYNGVVLRTESESMRLRAGLVTGNYFEVMGLSPILGRLTRPGDDGPGVAAVIVLTHDLWMRRFGGDSSVVGKVVRAGSSSATIIGVLQPAPFFPLRMDVLMNMVISPHHIGASMQEDRTHRMTEVVARMAPGVTFAQAKGEFGALYRRLGRDHPTAYDPAYHYRAEMIPFKDALGKDAQLTLWLLMGAAAFVLIIAMANVANLTLMRRVRREQELLVRAALGAGVAQLRRLVLAENLTLSVAGAFFGTLLAMAGLPLLISVADRYSARANEIQLDTPVLLFTLALSVATALFLSYVAAVPSEKELSTVASGGRRGSGGLSRRRLQRALVIVQVAVSVVLLAGAGLLTRTMLRLADVQTGLRTEQVLTMEIAGLANGADTRRDTAAATAARALFTQIRDEIAGLPGVEAVAIGSIPLRTGFRSLDLKVEGRVLRPGEAALTVDARFASPSYFTSLGIPLQKGRFFQTTDRGAAGGVVIVNEMLAQNLFRGEDPVGRRIAETNRIQQYASEPDMWFTIVGVVGNTQDDGLAENPRPSMYYAQWDESAMSGGLVVRAERGVAALSAPVIRTVRRLAPMGIIDNVMTVSQLKDESITPRRLNAVLVSAFGMLAVLIAAVGIAGVLAFSVSARLNEIGIRMSLGADRGRVLRMILAEGGTLLVIGLILGTAGALLGARVIQGLLFGIGPRDPITFLGVALLMGAIGIAACWIPALRAARVDPAITMRATG
ncbi:MAG: ABC transporter permease [Longimicrobiales bacterium]